MSKKKNTLKDLDEFLKQQAASLVSPEKLKVTQKEEETVEEVAEKPEVVQQQPPQELSFQNVLQQLKSLSAQHDHIEFRQKLYDLLLATMDAQHRQVPEDKIFINTLLYLKHGQRWKDGIKEYWQNHE